MNVRSAIAAGELHDEAFARDSFPAWERFRNITLVFQGTADGPHPSRQWLCFTPIEGGS